MERTGTVKVYKDGELLPTPFAELPSIAAGDRGLIGVAFDPDFAVNCYVYFYYTSASDLLNRLVRFNACGDVGTDGPFTVYQTNSPSQELPSLKIITILSTKTSTALFTSASSKT